MLVTNPAWARAVDTSLKDRRRPLTGYRCSLLSSRTNSPVVLPLNNVADIIDDHGFEAWEGFPFSAEKLEILAEKAKIKAASQTLESILISGHLDFVIGKDGAKVCTTVA